MINLRFPKSLKRRLRRFDGDERGVVMAEVAIGTLVMVAMILAVLDFGLAYARKLEMMNAARAGTQLALVRHPSLDPSADEEEALTSINEIRNAVLASATFLESDPGPDGLQVWLNCTCPDGTQIECVPPSGMSQPCSNTRTYAHVKLDLQYEYMVPYPAIGESIRLITENSVRLK